jgi:DNA-binding beta-propeller fold protein YncE
VLEIETASGRIARHWKTGQEVSHMVVPSPDERELWIASLGSGTATVIERGGGAVRSIPTGRGAEGIDVSPDGREVWVANRGDDTLAVIERARRLLLTTLPSGGSMPIRVRFTPDGSRVFVSHLRSDDIAVFDARSRTRVARLPARPDGDPRPGPVGLLPTPDGARLFFAHTTRDRVGVIDARTLAVVQWLDAGDEPDGMAWLP